MTRRGAFIVIEGLDRSGKTTQTELLAEHLATTTTTTGDALSVSRRKFPGKKERNSTGSPPPRTADPCDTHAHTQIARRAQAS